MAQWPVLAWPPATGTSLGELSPGSTGRVQASLHTLATTWPGDLRPPAPRLTPWGRGGPGLVQAWSLVTSHVSTDWPAPALSTATGDVGNWHTATSGSGHHTNLCPTKYHTWRVTLCLFCTQRLILQNIDTDCRYDRHFNFNKVKYKYSIKVYFELKATVELFTHIMLKYLQIFCHCRNLNS